MIEGKKHKDFPEYRVWKCMKDRCYNKNNCSFKRYGARGIIVCSEWLNDFPRFYSDMGPRPVVDGVRYTIERKDNDGNYTTSNCCWATYAEQGSNRSNTIKSPKVIKRINKTGYTGVYKADNRYRAKIKIDGVRIELGCFDTPEEAANAYNTAKG